MRRPPPLVLVFDRDAGTRAWYRAAFVSTDYRVAEAADGAEALELLTGQLPDLIITELRTHHRDGLTLCVIKRSSHATADIPILMVTLNGDADIAAAARLVGAAALIEKPRSSEALLAAADRLLVATSPDRLSRRQLCRALANLRMHAGLQAAWPDTLEQRARHLLAEAPSASSVLIANDQGKSVAVNAAACDLTGFSEAELIDRSVWDFARRGAIDRARLPWKPFLLNGECGQELIILRKGGSEIAVHLCALANVAPGLHAVVAGRKPSDNPMPD